MNSSKYMNSKLSVICAGFEVLTVVVIPEDRTLSSYLVSKHPDYKVSKISKKIYHF
jgi:hypothetical protein